MAEGYPLEDGELLMAAMHGDLPATKSLLYHNANIEVKGPNQATPLLLASRNGMSSMVRLLLKRGAQIEARSENGASALLWAAFYGHDATVRLLLDQKADINAKAADGKQALHAAIRGAQAPSGSGCAVVASLLARGADVTGIGCPCTPPLEQAKQDVEALQRTPDSDPQIVKNVLDVCKVLQAHFSSVLHMAPLRWLKATHSRAVRDVKEKALVLLLTRKSTTIEGFRGLSGGTIELLMRAINFRVVLPPSAAAIEWACNSDTPLQEAYDATPYAGPGPEK